MIESQQRLQKMAEGIEKVNAVGDDGSIMDMDMDSDEFDEGYLNEGEEGDMKDGPSEPKL